MTLENAIDLIKQEYEKASESNYINNPLEYWSLFDVKELPSAPKWDGHTAEQAIERIKNHFCPSIKGGANG